MGAESTPSIKGFVRFDRAQTLTGPQQSQARANIGVDLSLYQPLLIGIGPGQNLRTINGQSLLGQGDIAISVDLSAYARLNAANAYTQTWNAGATTFVGHSIDVTDTASANGSKILDIRSNGTSRISVKKVASATNHNAPYRLDFSDQVSLAYSPEMVALTLRNSANSADANLNLAALAATSVVSAGNYMTIGSNVEIASAGWRGAQRSINLVSTAGISWSSTTALSGTADVTVLRNATGPTLETRAAGGLRVCNADGSALGAVTCGSADVSASTKSAVSIRFGSATNTGLYGAANGVSPGIGFAIGGQSFLTTMDSGSGLVVHSAWGYCWTNGQADGTVDTRLTRQSAGVVRLGTTSADANGSLACANVTLSGFTRFGGITKTSLLALTPNATTQGTWRVIDSSPKPNRLARPTGTEWVWCDDETTVT